MPDSRTPDQPIADRPLADEDRASRPAGQPPAAPPRRRGRKLLLMLAGPAVVVAAGLWVWATGGRYVSTENAYVHADMIMVSADVSGRAAEVSVRENQKVAAGTVLFRIDPEPFRIALREAEAAVASARAEMAALKAGYAEAAATLATARETVEYAQRQFERQQQLRDQGVNSVTALDDARHALNQAVAGQRVAREAMARIAARLGGDPQAPIETLPAVRAAEAARARAALDLRRTAVHAPADGIVSKVDLQVGEYIDASEPVFALIEAGRPWLEANLKETDLTHVRPGQAAEVVVDTYPDRTLTAHVASISPATGSEFSILPAQNASGNWVKVVQRVPVRLVFDETPDVALLRSGMSATVEIDTGPTHRDLPGFISTPLAWAGVDS